MSISFVRVIDQKAGTSAAPGGAGSLSLTVPEIIPRGDTVFLAAHCTRANGSNAGFTPSDDSGNTYVNVGNRQSDGGDTFLAVYKAQVENPIEAGPHIHCAYSNQSIEILHGIQFSGVGEQLGDTQVSAVVNPATLFQPALNVPLADRLLLYVVDLHQIETASTDADWTPPSTWTPTKVTTQGASSNRGGGVWWNDQLWMAYYSGPVGGDPTLLTNSLVPSGLPGSTWDAISMLMVFDPPTVRSRRTSGYPDKAGCRRAH